MDKLIIFDCDGTLIDSEVIATKVFPAYWAEHGVNITELEFKEKFIGKGNKHPDVIELHKLMPEYVMEEGDRLWQQSLESNLQPVSGMLELIKKLKCKIAVGSNSSLQHVKWALGKTGLAPFFKENVFSANQVANAKPSPDLFLHIANEQGVALENCIVIEDSVSGVNAAQAAGIKVVAFSGAEHFTPTLEQRLIDTQPDYFISNIDDLNKLFVELNYIH